MKCSICNAENPPDAKSCHQCGFSLSLTQPTWPDFPTVEIPEPVAAPQWPELPDTGAPSAPLEPIWPDTDVRVSVEDIEIEPIAISEELVPMAPTLSSDDDELARSHIARGFEAIRKGLDEQAKWEFEQARDLADSPDIVQLAQAQLSGLGHPSVETAPEPVPPPVEIAQPAPPRPAQPRPIRPVPPRKPTPPPIPTQIRNIDWDPLVRIGLAMGLLNGVLTGCGAIFCLGLMFSPAIGYVSGWLAARRAGTTGTIRQKDQSSDTLPALVVGGITGLGGWLGGVIGHPIWVASTSTSTADPAAVGLVVACAPGILYILLSIVASVLGWRAARKSS
jgi:hypothetical protein